MSVWRYLLTPASGAGRRGAAAGVIALLVVPAAALALAPAFMPAGYDWVRHTTSESAAQGLAGAWVARLGFVAFGLAVLWLAAGAAFDPVEDLLHSVTASGWCGRMGLRRPLSRGRVGSCRGWCGEGRVVVRSGANDRVGS